MTVGYTVSLGLKQEINYVRTLYSKIKARCACGLCEPGARELSTIGFGLALTILGKAVCSSQEVERLISSIIALIHTLILMTLHGHNNDCLNKHLDDYHPTSQPHKLSPTIHQALVVASHAIRSTEYTVRELVACCFRMTLSTGNPYWNESRLNLKISCALLSNILEQHGHSRSSTRATSAAVAI